MAFVEAELKNVGMVAFSPDEAHPWNNRVEKAE